MPFGALKQIAAGVVNIGFADPQAFTEEVRASFRSLR
jgi:hypothetical protein